MGSIAETGATSAALAGARPRDPAAGRSDRLQRFGRFLVERFPPFAYGPLILAFVACGSFGAARAGGADLDPQPRHLAVTAVVALAFLRLRIVDELKDEAVDRMGRPDRPLARGLVTAGELRLAALVCAVCETALAAALGPAALAAYLLVLTYSLLSGVDFFAEEPLHENLVVYALVHAPVVPLLLGFVWWAQPGALWSPALGGLAVLTAGVSLGIEVARKTVAAAEERPFVETYSAALGQPRAVLFGASALAISALGGFLYFQSIGSSPTVTTVALALAIAVPLAGGGLGRTRHLAMLRACAVALGLALLLSPLALVLVELVATT